MNDKQQDEMRSDSWQPGEGNDMDINEAYPLMDAVARREGWDDPEMDSYDVYARKPHEPTT